MIMPDGVKTKFIPAEASAFPNDVVPNKSKSPTPATKGGNARGISKMVLMKFFPVNLYRARA